MNGTLFQQGLDLMLFGMGTVFVFLTLLVCSVVMMSAVVTRFFAELEEPQKDLAMTNPKESPAVVDSVKLRVIQDAIHQHRKKKQS